jgi:hypothetical protein
MMRRHGRQLQRLRVFFRDVAGESAQTLIAILVEHVAVDREAALLAQRAVRDADAASAIDTDIRDIERRGDQLRQRLVAELAQTLITPLDREDLFRFSRSLDDVLDNIRDFVREWLLYRPESERNLASLLEIVGNGVEKLGLAVSAISKRADQPAAHLLDAKRTTNHVRRRFEEEVAELFAGEVTTEVLKHRELLRRLDVVGLRLGEAVDILFDALVKRGEGLSLAPANIGTVPRQQRAPQVRRFLHTHRGGQRWA